MMRALFAHTAAYRRLCLTLALLALAPAAHAKPKAAIKHTPPSAPVTAPPSAAEGPGADSELHAAPEPPPPVPEPPPPTAAKPIAAPASAHANAEPLASLRSDVAELIDDMVQARARAALLGKTLFKTRLRLFVQNLAAPDPVLVKIVLTLDGAPIYHADGSALQGDAARQVFEGFVAPGPHVLMAELEQRSRADAAYGYTLHDSYKFQALHDKRSELTLLIDDDSDLASDFADDARGEYDVRVKLRVRTKDLREE
jgi:hypothetical protein